MKIHRNDKCPCGSGLKFKKCCYLDPVKNAEIVGASLFPASTPEQIRAELSKPLKIYKLKVVLIRMGYDEIEEEISRTLEVRGNDTLYDLHMGIQRAFNWDNDHMFSFYFGELFDKEFAYSGNPLGECYPSRIGIQAKSAANTQIRNLTLTDASSFFYLFDFGDELVHKVYVEEIRDWNDGDKQSLTIVCEVGKAPSQYGEYEEEDESFE